MSEQTRPIVVIEDEFTLKTGLKELLTKEGFKTESLKPSADMLSKLVSLNPSIIITDTDQENLSDPFKMVAAIKKTEKLRESELFVYTESIDVKKEVGLRKLKIVSYFTKSKTPKHLVSGIKNHFSWEEMSQEYDPFEGMKDEESASSVDEVAPLEDGSAPLAPAKPPQPEIAEKLAKPDNYEKSGEFQEMLDEFHEGIEKKLEGTEDGPEAYYNLGVSYFEMGLMDQALAQLKKSSKSPEWKLNSLNMIGAILRNQGQYDKAITTFKVCYKCATEAFEKLGFRYEIADTQFVQGKLVDAYKMFATVYKADKGFRNTRERLVQIKATLESKHKV